LIMGIANDAVFPLPVSAQPRMSKPANAMGMPCVWMGVGVSYLCSLMSWMMFGCRFCRVGRALWVKPGARDVPVNLGQMHVRFRTRKHTLSDHKMYTYTPPSNSSVFNACPEKPSGGAPALSNSDIKPTCLGRVLTISANDSIGGGAVWCSPVSTVTLRRCLISSFCSSDRAKTRSVGFQSMNTGSTGPCRLPWPAGMLPYEPLLCMELPKPPPPLEGGGAGVAAPWPRLWGGTYPMFVQVVWPSVLWLDPHDELRVVIGTWTTLFNY